MGSPKCPKWRTVAQVDHIKDHHVPNCASSHAHWNISPRRSGRTGRVLKRRPHQSTRAGAQESSARFGGVEDLKRVGKVRFCLGKMIRAGYIPSWSRNLMSFFPYTSHCIIGASI